MALHLYQSCTTSDMLGFLRLTEHLLVQLLVQVELVHDWYTTGTTNWYTLATLGVTSHLCVNRPTFPTLDLGPRCTLLKFEIVRLRVVVQVRPSRCI